MARFRIAVGRRVLLPLLLLAGCARNPVTGHSELALISESQEIEMGREAAAEVAQTIGLVGDAELQRYVRRVGSELATVSERPHLPWSFAVIEDPTPNAVSLPGGFVFVTRGLLGMLDSEAELAVVLGHEIGHVTARHAVAALSRARLAQVGFIFGGIFFPAVQAYGGWAGLGLDLLFLEYGRDAEHQADELGFRYALQRGYGAGEMVHVVTALQRLGKEEGKSPLPSWLSTHPAPEARIRSAQARAASLGPRADSLRRDSPAYLAHIDGLAYGENPRAGFFREQLFLHPEFRFQVEFPRGWRTQNLAASVVAQSPGRTAILRLTLSEEESAEAAARSFGEQEGVRMGSTRRESGHGIPTVRGEFQAQGHDGTVRGMVAFYAHEGRVFQLVGYTPALAFGSQDALFRRTLESFAPLTDPAVLALQPSRIRVVRLEESMSLAEFDRRHPSAAPLERLAVLNQLADPHAMIPAGSRLKRIVGSTTSPAPRPTDR